ncbi:50S ribosomal protein L15 [Candidatus Peregrinibacteria bacterium]|nr:50S ribosomal protein L15 [Candidatus Peregrinibacteria bacterium]
MKQHTLKAFPGSSRHKKRIGRGRTRGNYSGKGGKGQTARTGGKIGRGFEGGQTPLSRRMPKLKGFKNVNKIAFFPINIEQLEIFEDNATVDAKSLKAKGLIKKESLKLKLLATGAIQKKLNITVHAASAKAIAMVEKAGGTIGFIDTKAKKPDAGTVKPEVEPEAKPKKTAPKKPKAKKA